MTVYDFKMTVKNTIKSYLETLQTAQKKYFKSSICLFSGFVMLYLELPH